MKQHSEQQNNAPRIQFPLRQQLALYFSLFASAFAIIAAIALYVLGQFGFGIEHLKTPSHGVYSIIFLCMGISFVTAFVIINLVLMPLWKIENAAAQVAKGDFNVQIPYKGNLKEFGNTIQGFNQMVRELGSVEIMRNDFIANVSHEFKTPLTSIMGYATLLQDPELSEEERQEYIEKVLFSVEKLNDLTDNILQLSRLENQEYLHEPEQYRLDEQLREAIVLLEPKWSKKEIGLDLNLPEVSYTGQRSLLFQVWTNLIGNAIKFTEQGGTISVSMEQQSDTLVISISDNGIGMNPETQAHIFEKFYQADSAHRSQGNGLGLPLCKAILELCKGEIYVESQENVGSSFIVTLHCS